MPLETSAVRIACPYGTIGSITQLGVGNQDLERLGGAPNPMDICYVNFKNQACVPDNPNIKSATSGAIGLSEYML